MGNDLNGRGPCSHSGVNALSRPDKLGNPYGVLSFLGVTPGSGEDRAATGGYYRQPLRG